MALFAPPPLPPVQHHASAPMHAGSANADDAPRHAQWERPVFRAPDLVLPAPAQFASEMPFTVQFRGITPHRKGAA